ncbi:hypothetical protein BKA56DRAFT_708078 [Ilyonectria sp. MPI-CAGE-AT-0026]|nr:hypothetical protein BKA56DRAFT_708078 [Ilyonectria sp. MPI-CAGE-AT-0026]
MSVNPKPSYHLCPDFSISPPPNGQLTLGSVLKNLNVDGVSHPLNLNAVIDIPDNEIFPRDGPHSITGFSRTLKYLRSVQGSIWAWIFGPSGPGGQLSWLRSQSDDETLTVDTILTRYFSPTEEYMKKTLEAAGVVMFTRLTHMKKPIYLVTGIKVAVGAKLSQAHTSNTEASGKVVATDPNTGASGGASGSYTSSRSSAMGFDGSKPFVLGIRVRKIWWLKDGTRSTSDDVAGTVLGDSDTDEDEDIFTCAKFDDIAIDNDDYSPDKIVEEREDKTGDEPC